MACCPVNTGHCQCQPQDGVGCPYASPENQIRLAYHCGKKISDDRIAHLEAELLRAKEWPTLEMIAAGVETSLHIPSAKTTNGVSAIFRAMMDAAPSGGEDGR